MVRVITCICLVLYSLFVITPLLTVWADPLPYEAPKFEEYKPNGKPIIPKGIEVKDPVKPKKTTKKSDDGSMGVITWFSLLTPTIWNIIGDVVPAAYGRAYVKKYKLFKPIKANSRGDIRIVGRRQMPYWLTRWKWLEKAKWTIGKIDLGKWVFARIEGYEQRLKAYGFVDLVRGKRYTQEELKQTEYAKSQRAFHPQMKIGEIFSKGWKETKNALQEAFLITKESVKRESWWKLTGKVGVVFSGAITTLDYIVDPEKHLNSPEYVAALPLDFGIGVLVATISAPVGVFVTTGLSFILATPLALVVGITFSLFAAFLLGLAIENIPMFKKPKDWVHKKLTSAIIKGVNSTNQIFKSSVKLGMNVANKTVSISKTVANKTVSVCKTVANKTVSISKTVVNKTMSVCKSAMDWLGKKIG